MKIDMRKFAREFDRCYSFLYDHEEMLGDGVGQLTHMFDGRLGEESFKRVAVQFAEFRHDGISSDREAAAFVLAFNKEVEAVE